jgi:hypothetical protein
VLRTYRRDGVGALTRRLVERLRTPAARDHHVWHPTASSLEALIEAAGFTVQESYWHPPPDDFCVYIRAVKTDLPGAG